MRLSREAEETIERQIAAQPTGSELSVLYACYRRCHDLERFMRDMANPTVNDCRIGYILRRDPTGTRLFINSPALMQDMMNPNSDCRMVVYRELETVKYEPPYMDDDKYDE